MMLLEFRTPSVWGEGVATSRTPVVYRTTKLPLEESLFRRKTGGMNYPGSQRVYKSDEYFTEQNKQWTNNICTGLTSVNCVWNGGNLCKLPFGKPNWEYQSENRRPKWENNIKTNLKWLVSKGVHWVCETRNKEYLQAFVYMVMILRVHKNMRNILTRLENVNFSRKIVLCRVSSLAIVKLPYF
jgi:hypothetical protein